MKIIFFKRKANDSFFSIEELFDAIQKSLMKDVAVENVVMPYKSSGILNRVRNIVFSLNKKGDINHITGDIHYLGLFLPRRNTILTIHDCGELEKQKGIKKFILWLFWFYLPAKRLKYITVISESTKAHLLKYVNINSDKIRVIPNCLIGNYITYSRPFNQKRPIILQVGTTPNKNLERVAAALEDVSCVLKIIGKPSKEQVRALNNYKIDFRWVANLSRDQVIEEYKNCDFVIFVSLLEGFGLPIIEAQASGKAVITSNISPMAATAGKGAHLVNPFDVADIKKGVLKIIAESDYRNARVAAGIENSKRFSVDSIANKYLNLYSNIMCNNKV
ncbi:MAG: glycosyltransferase family 4 protein [Agriterribacter sp.]